MMGDTGRYVIVFNGEIYNFRQLRQNLLDAGENFRTTGDTEVLLKLFRRRGPACLEQLNGMFAFAIWDRNEKTLFAARDRMGEKPFYYAGLAGGGIAFASELKALRTYPGIGAELDPCSLGALSRRGIYFRRTHHPQIHSSPSSGKLSGDGGGKAPIVREYWSLASAFGRRFSGSQAQAEAVLRDLLDNSLA